MSREKAFQVAALSCSGLWLALSGCGMGGGGCGGANPNAQVQPDCNTGYYAQRNSDGSYGPCQPIPNSGKTGSQTTTTSASSGP